MDTNDDKWRFAVRGDSMRLGAKGMFDIEFSPVDDGNGIICCVIEVGDSFSVVAVSSLRGRLVTLAGIEGISRTRMESLFCEPLIDDQPLPTGIPWVVPVDGQTSVRVKVADFSCIYFGASDSSLVAKLRDRPLAWLTHALMDELKSVDLRKYFLPNPPSKLRGLPKAWELLGFALPWKMREEIFEPTYNELLTDYLSTRSSYYQTPVARYWLSLCFTFRTIALVVECLFVGSRDRLWSFALALIPPALRQRVWEYWSDMFR